MRINSFPRIGWVAFLFWPNLSFAHSPSKGLAGFYTGILHVYSEVSLVIGLLALGLLVGQSCSTDKQRKLLVVFLLAIVISSAMASFALMGITAKAVLLVHWTLVVLVCLHAALLPKWREKFAFASVPLMGLIMGQLTVPDAGELWPFLVTLVGSITACVLGFLYSFALVDFLYQRFQLLWQRTIFRVVSAWLFAISFLLLAVQFVSKNI